MILKKYRSHIIILVVVLSFTQVLGQNGVSGMNTIKKLIAENKIDEANTFLDQQITVFKSEKNYDSLVAYIAFAGSLSLAGGDDEKALQKAEKLTAFIKNSGDGGHTARALVQLSNLYFTARKHDRVLTTSEEALLHALKNNPQDATFLAIIHYNLGTASLNLGNTGRAKHHLHKSKALLLPETCDKLRELYNTYNSLGRYYAHMTQLDSSTSYYKEALNILNMMDRSEENRDYWKAIVSNNISLNLQNTGHTNEAIAYIRNAISAYQEFILVATDESKKLRAQRFRLGTIDNLGTFYHALGEYNRAVEIITYSYRQKLQLLKRDDPNIVFSLAILGHAHLSAKNFELAGEYTDKALELIAENPSNYSNIHSYAIALRASIFEASGQLEDAGKMYALSEEVYKKSFDGVYSKDYLDALINMSLFYVKTGAAEKALSLAETGYQYTGRDQFQNRLIHFHHIQNLADVHFELKNYQKAQQYSREALSVFSERKLTSASFSDSIQIEFRKPRALLVNAKATYYLQEEKNEAFLSSLLKQIETGIAILERRKILVKTPDDLNILIEENNGLFNFAKQLRLDLYNKTKEDQYLLDLVSMHESGIYNRIRSRLNIRNNLAFADIPQQVIDRERQLKKAISESFHGEKSEKFTSFFDASEKWDKFLDSLKNRYPHYFKMRYATIEEPLDKLQQNIPKETTIVRYLFIEDELYAFVVSASEKNLFKLDFKGVKEFIPQLIENEFRVKNVSPKLTQLYRNLWQPFEKKVTTERVVIIPDRELFNLSFELLTPSPISSFGELSYNSLLAKHAISYSFSLLVQNMPPVNSIQHPENFVAFAPEFSSEMKNDYQLAVADSVLLDKSYLTLLPQPFSVDLVKEYTRKFSGNSFLNENASKSLFTQNAGEHKIIHIGTHAESNNVSPELSRLIFAKNISEKNMEDNFIYTYELYNYNLSSDLAILTACETGKPGYQAGEGMISLAHAFTYAGSESILTSLWKIDEKSSAEILASFYNNLLSGMSKDKALQKAKLTYLASAEGRTLAPQYWSGLVLMGDTAPMVFTGKISWYWIAGGIVLFLLLFLFLRRRKIHFFKGAS